MIVRENFDKHKVAELISVLLEPLTKEQCQYLLDNIRIHVFRKNEILYKENDKPVYLMCLLNGKIKVYKSGVGGRTQIIRVISETGVFGYRPAIVKENYRTSAAAFEESTVCMVPVGVIKELVSENNDLALFFIRELATMLGESDLLAIRLTQKHIRARIAESLITLKNKYGVDEASSTLQIYLSRDDLAYMSNMTTSNAIRMLSSFASEHIIALDGKKIKIIDENELIRIANNG